MIYRRGKAYWYNFRWTITNPDGTKESFRIVKSARAKNRDDAKDAEDEHRRALRLGQIHPRDPWPQTGCQRTTHFSGVLQRNSCNMQERTRNPER